MVSAAEVRQYAPHKSADKRPWFFIMRYEFSGYAVSLENFNQLLAADMAAVDQVIRARLHSEVALVSQVGQYKE